MYLKLEKNFCCQALDFQSLFGTIFLSASYWNTGTHCKTMCPLTFWWRSVRYVSKLCLYSCILSDNSTPVTTRAFKEHSDRPSDERHVRVLILLTLVCSLLFCLSRKSFILWLTHGWTTWLKLDPAPSQRHTSRFPPVHFPCDVQPGRGKMNVNCLTWFPNLFSVHCPM